MVGKVLWTHLYLSPLLQCLFELHLQSTNSKIKLLRTHSIPLGRPSAPAPSIQNRASNLDWQLISYMIFYPDPSSKATLWVKAQHEGALPPPCIVRKDPRVPHTARRGA